MGAGTTCIKCILVVTNLIFTLIGLILFGIGVYLKVGANDQINEIIQSQLQGIPFLPDLVNMAQGEATKATDQLSIDFHQLLSPIAIALIVIGIVIGGIAICGFVGACCNSKLLMIIYAILVAAVLLAQVVLVAIFYTGHLDGEIKSRINDTIVNEYVSITDFGVYSLTWNWIMSDFECCGLENYHDFDYAKKWEKERTFNVSGLERNLTLVTPVACCNFEGDWPNVDVVDDVCAITPTDAISNWKKGCWDAVKDKIKGSKTMSIGIISAILAVQACVLFGAILVICGMGKAVDPV